MDEIAILRTLAPSVNPATSAEVNVARMALLGHIDRQAESRSTGLPHLRRPSLRRPTLLAFGALVLAGMVSVAGAAFYLGEFGPVDHPATADQIEAEITSTMADTPLPAGRTYPVDALRTRAEPAGNLTVFAGVQQVQFYAMCAWSGAWLEADLAGDRAGVARATEMIATFPAWKSVSDPRLADDSIRTQIESVVVAAQAGNRGPVQGLFDGMMCSTILGN